MNKFIFSTLACMAFALTCFGQVQSDANLEEYTNYKKAEAEINVVYQRILQVYSSDTEFIGNLKAAQRLWIQFRDAEVKARYPEKGQYGSVLPMCRYILLTQITNERTQTLRVWLQGIPEGDVCSGSVKVNLLDHGDGDLARDPNRSSPVIKSFGIKVLNIPANSFEDDFNENAKIAMDIVTDANGKVISATYQPRGSTTSNPQMVSIARRRAFELKSIGSGDGPQKGTVIFNFKVRS